MKNTLLIIVIIASVNTWAGLKFKLQDSVFYNAKIPFLEHKGEGRFSSYLSMEVNYNPIANLFLQLQSENPFQLINRGEAHITVITPVEYYDILKNKITIDDINQIARNLNIQQSRFNVICLGHGQVEIEGNLEKTFYVVVKSNDLIEIRKQIQTLFISRGGNKRLFNPSQYYPHITLGFTKRDLHDNDGVIKNETSCIADIEIIKEVK